MRTSTTGTTKIPFARKRGFTAIELLVVLAIMLIMSGIIIVSIGPSLKYAKMRTACSLVVSSLNYARSRAVASGITTRVVFDNGESIYTESHPSSTSSTNQIRTLTTSAGRKKTLPSGVKIVNVTKSSGSSNENWIEFYSLGQSEATVIELQDNNNTKRYVIVDAFTGRCKIRTSDEIKKTASIE